MHDLDVVSAINKSQDGEALVKWMTRNRVALEDIGWHWTDALNALLMLAYDAAEDTDELERDLFYAKRQIEEALWGVQKEANRVR